MAHRGDLAAAFAEGRRLRAKAEARRRRAHRRMARHTARAVVRRHGPPPFVVLPLIALVMAGVGVLGVAVMAFVSTLMVVLAVIAAFMLVRRVRRALRPRAAGTAPLQARARPLDWQGARDRFRALQLAYATYECDALKVLRLPALADVTVPSTGRFVEAFAEAQALATDAPPPAHQAAQFAAAVSKAEAAWRAARDAAERIRLSRLSPTERSTVERVVKLLTTARDSDNDAERLAAYSRARSELGKLDRAGVVHVPLPAQAALDAAARGQLPA